MPSFKTGDRVKIVDRPTTGADAKSGLYYDYFCNLIGTVDRVYDDNSVCVQVDFDSLPEGVQKRHMTVQDAVKKRWTGGLGAEQTGRLTEAEKNVSLRYNILVGSADLEASSKAKPASRPKADTAANKPGPADTAERRTQADIEKAEEEYLKSIAANKDDK